MITPTNPGGSSRRFSKRRFGAATAAVALIATGAVTALGAGSFANGDEGGAGPLPPPGEQPIGIPADIPAEGGDLVIGSSELITTGGSTFDATVVSKYIPAQGFQVTQGATADADLVAREALACVRPDATSGGVATILSAPVELPDGARIKRVSFYGQDDDAIAEISVQLLRTSITTPLTIFPLTPTSTRETTSIDQFSTSGQQSDASVFFGANDLEERTGSTPDAGGGIVLASGTENRFHTVTVRMVNSALANHVLCGVRVDYQVAAPADPGTVFHPVGPIRAFDSRQGSFAETGLIAPNETKVIDITDGYDNSGVAIPGEANVVPSTATAVAYNITVAGATRNNFIAVTAGDAASFTASAINFEGGSNIANSSTVPVASDQTIKLWAGPGPGAAHVIIDIVGYYAPPVNSNMAN